MRVGLDTQGILSGRHSSGSYFLELLPELLRIADADDRLVVFRTGPVPDSQRRSDPLAWLARDPRLGQMRAPFRGRRARMWRALGAPGVERLARAPGLGRPRLLDVCHSLVAPLMPSRAARRLLTVHRLETTADGKLPRALQRSLLRAHRVIVTSQRLHAELRHRLEQARPRRAVPAAQRLLVIRPGIHERYREPPKQSELEDLCDRYPFLGESYLLAAGGAAEPEWSVPFLAEACRLATASDPTLPPLVVLAQPGDSAAIASYLQTHDLVGRLLLIQDLTTGSLPALYRGAELVLYPGRDLAFGQSVADAAANAVPAVIGPACGALEMLGAAATVPGDETVGAWSAAILALHQNNERRRALGERSRERSAAASWRRVAQDHWQLYSGVDRLE